MPVDVDMVIDDGVASPITSDDVARIVALTLEAEGVSRPCMVSVSMVGDERMRELNATWRDRDVPTDVLSLECERPDDPGLGEGEPCELGDIVLAPAYILEQATRLGTTVGAEMTLMLVHGTLHLLGYDHLNDEDAQVMEQREDAIVASILGGGVVHVATTRHRDMGRHAR